MMITGGPRGAKKHRRVDSPVKIEGIRSQVFAFGNPSAPFPENALEFAKNDRNSSV